jgi:hypothetical protein
MSDNQAPGAGQAGEKTSAALELLKLRGAISDIALDEGRLKIQEGQLQVWVARYKSEAQDSSDATLAAKAQQQLDTLQPQLANVREQLARLQAEKEALTQQQQSLLEKLNISSVEQARTLTSADSGIAWSPPPPIKLSSRRRRKRLFNKPVFWFSAVLVILVVILAVVSGPHLSFTTQPSSTTGLQAPTPTPTAGPAFTPQTSLGPSNLVCQNEVDTDCFSPEQIQQAFNLNALYHAGFEGQGQTIVILGAGHTFTLPADLHHFDQAWGLPDPTLQILQPHGPPTAYTCADGQDDLEIENTLDVEWSHAIAPGARIILIVGDNNSQGSPQGNCLHYSLTDDIIYALDHHLGNIISISYSGSELGVDTDSASAHAEELNAFRDADAVFQQAARQHVTVLAATGDTGPTSENDYTKTDSYWNQPNVQWPADDPYVLAVGGTSLTIADANGTYDGESVWGDKYAATGGGISSIFAEPAYQKLVPNQKMFQGKRGLPDVAFPAGEFVLYNSISSGYIGTTDPQFKHWDVAGGTSLSTPCWAGIIAIADQMNRQPLGLIQPALYWMSGQGMHDITIGDNSFANVLGYQAQPGYDLASGWGTPIADEFIPALLQATLDISPGCRQYHRQCTWEPQSA